MDTVIHGESLLTENDIYLFKQGSHFKLFDKLGSHPVVFNDRKGTLFGVWAPNAERVSVIGDFNGWNADSHQLAVRWDGSGIWEGFIPEIGPGEVYKYSIVSRDNHYRVEKADPFAKCSERPPRTASVICDLAFEWSDQDWMQSRKDPNSLESPNSIYEVHLGSWRRPVNGEKYLTYREMAPQLADYVKEMGFTHVEFMPVMEHPFYGSWGYQTVGYFAPTSRYGSPSDLMYLIDHLHQNGIGVILDWVPSHFPSDEHGLCYFDGSHLYEHADPKRGFHPDWKSYIFNHGRNEVRNFLISSALFWLENYHVDGLRVDAVASMLYLDYSRNEGEWIPNHFGGREDLDAISFLKRFNEMTYQNFPDTQTYAEESTDWPMVSRPAYVGGLGFGQKWNMGWMHDCLEYFCKDPIHRKYHHQDLTFSIWYAFTENFVLPLSHDEVVHGKSSLLGKMPGDDWQKFANLRLLFGFMFGHPGKKLVFMGGEFGQWNEWNHESSLDWHLLEYDTHQGVHQFVKDVNRVYKENPALYEKDFEADGFEWVDLNDWENSTISFLRRGKNPQDCVLVICNFTPVPRDGYRVGAPFGGTWEEILNSDATTYGGGGIGNYGIVQASDKGWHGRDFSLKVNVPPLAVLFLRPKK